MLDVLYLVPNLADAAVWRRVRMMEAGGAAVRIAGFRRAGTTSPDPAAVELGETHDARFAQRIKAVASAWPSIRRRLASDAAPGVIVARNLEMLPLAHRLAAAWPERPPVAYECLDIHRLLLRKDAIGGALRAAERRFASDSALLITSSPAFAREYFDTINPVDLPVVLVENKVFDGLTDRGINPALQPYYRGPLRIGWFGALRCRTSLDHLAAFTRAMEGRFEAILRGRPAADQLGDLAAFVADQPYLRFEGPYRNPDDLGAIYSGVHFAWAIDFFEAGQNSDWLLPNRLYEGCLHGAIPIAVDGTETAAWLRDLGLGVILPDAEVPTLAARLGALTQGEIMALAHDVQNADPSLFRCSKEECAVLVERLAATRPSSTSLAVAA